MDIIAMLAILASYSSKIAYVRLAEIAYEQL